MSDKMKAVVIDRPGSVKVVRKDVPVPAPDEVLIRVQYAGICSTDSMILAGIYSKECLPMVPGHEFIGRIAEMGSAVRGWEKGDYVTADINLGCGTCRYCLRNQPLACGDIKQLGIHRDGGFAEYLTVPAGKLIRLGGTADPKEYALAEPLSNVVRSLERCGSLLGRSAAVLGNNFLSLLHVQMLRLAGAWPVVMVSDDEEAGRLGKELGADRVLPYESESGEYDFVFETEGSAASYNTAHTLTAPGGHVMAFGIPPAGIMAAYEPFAMVLKEQGVLSSVAGAGPDVLDAVSLIESGRLDLSPWTKTVLPLEEAGRGMDLMEMDKNVFKVLLEVNV